MSGIPSDVGEAIDKSLCEYSGYFPKIDCVTHKCKKCGTQLFKEAILQKNGQRIKDKRKRFLVKLWVTKTERKQGVTQSYLHWKFERCNYIELIDLLMDHMKNMSEHTFMASWNYVQYKQAKKNILVGDLIFVHDFAQNYLCLHQNECQGLHWRHKQVTMMPTNVSKCEQLVTHEIVHVTDDLKHDAHIVKMFTEKSIKIIQNNNVNICKIIEFTDQAPSQYKNKTAFNYLANTKIPMQKNYFGVRHGKSSCDACTGRVKQGVTRLVKNGDVVVNNAETFYDTCVKHLEKPMDISDKCQHYMLTFELHRKICKRPSTEKWPGIPDTRKLHQIGNTGGKVLYFQNFSCCCFGCLHGTVPCQNNICPSDFTAFDLGTKKSAEANLSHWFGVQVPDEHKHNMSANDHARVQPINWPSILQALAQQQSFVQLRRYVNANPIPDLICQPDDKLR